MPNENYGYLFIRTKYDLKHSSNVMDDLDALIDWDFPDRPVRRFSFSDAQGWLNGMVLGLPLVFVRHEAVTRRLDRALTKAESWAYYEAEFSREYPISTALDKFVESYSNPSQMYLRYNRENPREQGLVDELRSLLERHNIVCRPVFHFKDGVVLFASGGGDPRVVFRRCESVAKRMSGFLFVSPLGEALSTSGSIDTLWPRYFERKSLGGLAQRARQLSQSS